jgi:outer membrane biosynthesis protein TonB
MHQDRTVLKIAVGLLGIALAAGCGAATQQGEVAPPVIKTVTTAEPTTTARSATPTAKPSAAASKPAGLLSMPPTTKPAKPATTKPTARNTTKPKPKPTNKPTTKPKPKPTTEAAYYKNCDAVRAAGKAPIHRGDPGYSRKLDRDGDGIGCEN